MKLNKQTMQSFVTVAALLLALVAGVYGVTLPEVPDYPDLSSVISVQEFGAGGEGLRAGVRERISIDAREDVYLYNGADLYMYSDDHGTQTIKLDGGTGTILSTGDWEINGTTPFLTIGDAGEEDAGIIVDGAAQDFYLALDDSADDLLIGLGSTVGTTPGLALDENLAVTTYGDVTMTGATPVLTIGDAGEEDAALVWNGAAQDFYCAMDDSADDLVCGLGSTVGTTPILSMDEALGVTFGGTVDLNGGTLYIGADQGQYIDELADDVVVWQMGAGTGVVQYLTGNLLVGNGNPTLAQDGEDAYVEGVLEVDGGMIAPSEVVTVANVLTAAECGKVLFLNSASEFQTTLPALSTVVEGCSFEFWVAAAPAEASYTIITGNSLENKLYGQAVVNGAAVASVAQDTITFTQAAAVLGDWVRLVSDGTNWYVSGMGVAATSVAFSQAD